jgi:hypothetical protein
MGCCRIYCPGRLACSVKVPSGATHTNQPSARIDQRVDETLKGALACTCLGCIPEGRRGDDFNGDGQVHNLRIVDYIK